MAYENIHIGFVGDGQLARMTTEAALAMGHEVTVLGEAGPNSPAALVGARQLDGSVTDAEAIRRLAEVADVITWDTEHVNSYALISLATQAYANVRPSPFSLREAQDKVYQKSHFVDAGLPVAPFRRVSSAADFTRAVDAFGEPGLIVKTRTGGYDGRGNLVPDPDMTWHDIQDHFTKEGTTPALYVEQLIPFVRELALMGARSSEGEINLWPVVETVQENGICRMVLAPADIPPPVRERAEQLGRRAIEIFKGPGVFAVEMFQTPEEEVLINELATRVHNSGHWTIEGSETSQFTQLVNAITGRRLGSTVMTSPAAVMVNILGTRTGPFDERQLDDLRSDTVFPHGYGKSLRPARKVGHVTALGDTLEEAKAAALAAHARIDA